jgi:large subunit GTPase 1
MPPKKQSSSLGKAMIKSRFRNNNRQINADGSIFHTTDIDDSWKTMQSITQEDDLEAFLRTAQLAGTEFTAGRRVNL